MGAGPTLSCENALAPLPGRATDLVVVATLPQTDSGSLAVIDPQLGKVTAHIGPLPRLVGGGPTSADRATLYLSAALDDPTIEIVAVDTKSLRIQWRMRLTAFDQQAVSDSLHLTIGSTMALTPDGKRLLLGATTPNGGGVAVVSLDNRQVTGFIPFVPVGRLASVAPNTALPNGAIIVTSLVRQFDPERYTGMLYVLDGATLAIRDSLAVTQASDDFTADILQVVAAPDGEHVYVVGIQQQFRYDLASHQITDSVATPSFGTLSIAPDGKTLYRSDFGDFDSPGSGKIYVYDADLTPRAPIELSQIAPSPTAKGQPVVSDNAVASSDGRLLYVAAGTPAAGGYVAYEPARLLVLDLQTNALVRTIPLSGASPFVILVR